MLLKSRASVSAGVLLLFLLAAFPAQAAPSSITSADGLRVTNQAPIASGKLSIRSATITPAKDYIQLDLEMSEPIPATPSKEYRIIWEVDTDLNADTGRKMNDGFGVEYNLRVAYYGGKWQGNADRLENPATKGGGRLLFEINGNIITTWVERHQIDNAPKLRWRVNGPDGCQLTSGKVASIAVAQHSASASIAAAKSKIVVVIPAELRQSLNAEVEQWCADLRTEGLEPLEMLINKQTTPADIRARLIVNQERLAGVVFIGAVPIAYTLCPTSDAKTSTITYHYTPCDNYYQDLDGSWSINVTQAELEAYALQANKANKGVDYNWFDAAQTDFRVQNDWKRFATIKGLPDTYVGRITAQGLGLSPAEQIACLREYFRRNHAYRTSGKSDPRLAIYAETISHGDPVRAQETANHGLALSSYTEMKYYVSKRDQYKKLLQTLSSLLLFNAHGGVAFENDRQFGVDEITQNPPQARFILINGCNACDYHLEKKSIGSTYLHCPGSQSLCVIGFPIAGGMGGLEFFSDPLNRNNARSTLGTMYLNWYRNQLRRVYLPGYYVFLGDPTLRMQYPIQKQ